MRLRRHPLVYEINSLVWLDSLSKRYQQTLTLADIPGEVLDGLAGWHFDAVWLMGVWERSPKGREIALQHPGLQNDYRQALPDYRPDQVVGSPYAIRDYAVDARLGGREALAHFRQQLAARGIKLILDYVPNHVAVDHPWTIEHPECLVQGSPANLADQPDYFFSVTSPTGEQQIFANGRDPYFPPWTDTVQIDAFSPTARQRTCETLLEIAEQCDGVRCDMVMLVVNRIFGLTWKRTEQPVTEFWAEVIPAVRAQFPDFVFMAEVYWNMEYELQALGFDFTYDKRLYDRMLHEPVSAIRDHLTAPVSYQQKLVRFVENHDELRALSAFGPHKVHPVAALAASLPGMKLFHEGQFEGRQVRLPVQLGAAPEELTEQALWNFYRQLLTEIDQLPYHGGVFMLLAALPMPGAAVVDVHERLIAFAWALGEDWRVVVVNLGEMRVQARVMLPRPVLSNTNLWRFQNVLNPVDVTVFHADNLLSGGLTVDLDAWSVKILHMEKV